MKSLKAKFASRRKPRQVREVEFSIDELKAEIIKEAKTLRIDAKSAEVIAENTTQRIAKWVEKRVTFTQNDLYQHVADEVKRYNKDLAYVYQNRGKII